MTTMTIEQAEQIIRDNRREVGEDLMVSAVCELFNCREASVDDNGDIWIEGPMIGRWLSDEEKLEFVAWDHTRQ